MTTEDLAKEAREAAANRMTQIERSIENLRCEIVDHGKLLATILANTSPLPELHRRLRENEKSTSSLWTVLKVTWAVIAVVAGAAWLWVKS